MEKHDRRLDQLIGSFDFLGGENGVYRGAQRVVKTLIAESYLRIGLLKKRRQEKLGKDYQPGVSCHHCICKHSPEQRQRYAERERQIELAQRRGEEHLGHPMEGE